MMISIPASELQLGDIVHYNARVDWKVETLAPTKTGKSINMSGIYTKCDFAQGRIAQPMHWSFRVGTVLRVTRD